MSKNVVSGNHAFMKAVLAVTVIFGLIAMLGFTKAIAPDKMAAYAYMPGLSVFSDSYFGVPQDDKVFTEVKNPPEYPGGLAAMQKFIVDNIQYPAECKKTGKQGTAYVSFVVDKSGKIKDAKVLKSVHPLIDAEALRIVKMMPTWKAGTDDAKKAVNVAFTLPIKFKLK